MALWWKKTKEPYWPEDKLIAAYHIYRTPHQEVYYLHEFNYPIHYPLAMGGLVKLPKFLDLPLQIEVGQGHFLIQRDHAKLRAKLNNYLKKFRSEELIHPKRIYFNFVSTKKILMNFLISLAHFQGRDISFILKNFKDNKDEFHLYFQQNHEEEYSRWINGNYHFPFYETLFSLHQLRRIDLGGFDLEHQKLYVRLPQKKPTFVQKFMSNMTDEKINLIEILPTRNKEFFAYVNKNYVNPISFNLKDKSSQVLYSLALDGEINLKSNKQAYHYIQQNKRFRLFSRSNISHHKLLNTYEGHIIPATGVKFQLISEKDLVI